MGRIANIRIFDPACGSGNFLIIAYRELRKLEIEIIRELDMFTFSNIQLQNFYGIEISDFACEVAKLSLWLAEHQMNMIFKDAFGQCNPTLPLEEAGQITCGNATRIDWAEVCPKNGQETYVLGNPPYSGARKQTKEQKADLGRVFAGVDNYKNLDYIACWFYIASNYIQGTEFKFAFVTTNSITQGEQVALLWPHIFANNQKILFAHTSFKWSNNAKNNAGITCAIVGIGDKTISQKPIIYSENLVKYANNINPYLLDAANIYAVKRTRHISNLPHMNFGDMPNDGGGLIFSEPEYQQIITEHPSAKRFFRKYIGSEEFINGGCRYCLWLEDGDLPYVSDVPAIQNGIEKSRQHRIRSKDTGTRELAARAHQFRDRNTTTTASIIVPRVSSERRPYIPIGFLGADTIISDSAMAVYEASVDLFAILTSYMHMLWVRTVGGRLKTDYRYSATLCYNTFPFPRISERQKKELSEPARQVLSLREMHSEKTLAELYDPDSMPKELKEAHHQLDLAVERCYRSKPFESDEERLEHLFNLYERMIAAERE